MVEATGGESPGFAEALTPNGLIEIRYYWENKDVTPKVKRHYEIRSTATTGAKLLAGEGQGWVEVPSVTTVNDILAKDLSWWGMEVGVTAETHLLNLGAIQLHWIPDRDRPVVCVPGEGGWVVADPESIIKVISAFDMSVNDVRDAAGDRGTAAHDALEAYARGDVIPDPGMFPPEQQGYIEGLRKFLIDVRPEVIDFEVMVASIEHGYAGRYDIRFRLTEPRRVVKHFTPVGGDQWAELPAGEYLGDLKTAKSVYITHAKQLSGYELASVEGGWNPTDGQGILHVTSYGKYRFVRNWMGPEGWLSTLGEFKQQAIDKKNQPKGLKLSD